MGHPENETITTTAAIQQEENRLAFLRYLPRRIADFERRILRYRFHGWDPNGMMVLAGDARRLADASANYGLDETREHLLALSQMVNGHASSMRGPDPKQAERMFALLSAVLRSLPAATTSLAHPVVMEAPGAVDAHTADGNVGQAAVAPSAMMEVQAPAAAADARASGAAAVEPSASIEETPTVDDGQSAEAIGADAIEADATKVETIEPETTKAAATDAADEVPELPPHGEPVVLKASADPDALDVFVQPPLPEADAPTASLESDAVAASPVPATTVDAGSAATGMPVEHASPPANPDEPEPPVAASFDEVEEPEAVGGLGMRRIYHLSDGNAFAVELGERLESEGYAMESVENIDELAELFTCLVPHMLLVDASHVSRLAIIGALRRDAQQQSQPPRHIRMIVMAAQDGVEIRRAAHRAGADLLLFPPFDLAGLSDRLKALYASTEAEPVRVLVVDDERSDALFAQAVLNRAGMHARVEHDPMRVLEALASERPDLILMDLHMPFANGVEVTMLIREDPSFARIPIVFLSGESDPDSRLEAINAGGDDFLFKPIRPRHLVAAVQDRVRRLHAVDRQAGAIGDMSVA